MVVVWVLINLSGHEAASIQRREARLGREGLRAEAAPVLLFLSLALAAAARCTTAACARCITFALSRTAVIGPTRKEYTFGQESFSIEVAAQSELPTCGRSGRRSA